MADLNVITTHTPDKLIAGTFPIETEIAVVSGGNYARGTVLGKISANGKLIICNSAGTDDGRRAPYAILAEATDASGGDKNAVVYLSGAFNASALTFGGSDTIATHKDALRALSIFARQENRDR